MSVLSDERDVYKWEGFPGGSAVKNLSANAGDEDLIPGLGRSPREGRSNPPILTWEIPWSEEPWPAPVQAVTKSRHNLETKQQ